MIKTLRLMLLALLTMVGGNVLAETVTWNPSELYSANTPITEVTVNDKISLVADKASGTTAPQYYANGTSLRLYAGNTLAVNGAEGVTITKVVFTFGSGDGSNEITSDVESFDGTTWTGESQNVVFTESGTKGNRRIAAVEVTYDVAAAGANEATWLASSHDALQTVLVGNDLTLKWEEGGGDMAPKYSGDYVYFYNGNRVTVAGASDAVKIQKIVFKFKADTKNGLATCDASGKNVSTAGITNDNEALTTTWEGEANSVIFRATQGTGVRYIESITVTYEGSAPVVAKAPVLAITQDNIADTYDMDANGVFVVYYENQGNVAAENAKLTLFVDGAENASKTIGTLNIGASAQNFWNAKYNLEGLEAGEHQVYLSLTADNAETVSTTAKTVTFTKKAPEAAYTISAQAVTVPYDTESYAVVATLKETNNVAGANVKVQLRKGIADVLAEQTIEAIAANGEQQVTLTVAKELFEEGEKTYNLYVNDKFLAQVAVTFEAAPVTDQIDMAITAVQGPNTIDLAAEAPVYKVYYENKGNVKVENAEIKLLVNDNEAGSETVTVEPNQSGVAQFTLDVATLFDPAEDLGLEATIEGFVNVDGDVDATNNKSSMTATITKSVPQATFEVAAENVTVAYGAESYQVVAKVKNTSETVAAEGVQVLLQRNAQNVADAQTIDLAAGEEKEVTFTVAAPEGGFTPGETQLWVMVKAYDKTMTQQEVTITFEEAPAEEVIDMAIVAIQGVSKISLQAENKVQVWYQNKGTKDLENVAIMFSMNDNAQEQAVNVEAGKSGYAEFTIDTSDIEPAEDTEAELVAWVNVEGDADATNNKVTKVLPIVSGEVEPAAEIAINPISGWEVEAGEQEISVSVVVYNNGDADAKDVKIQLYKDYPTILAEETIDVPAGDEVKYKYVTMKFNYTFEQGKNYEFTVFTNYADDDASNNMQTFTISCPAPVAEVGLVKIADIQATTEEEVKINAVVKNNSSIEATDVKVGVYTQDENFQYQLVGLLKTIETIAAGEQAEVEFNLGTLEAGTYRYYVRIVNNDANMDNNMQDVTVKVTEPVADFIDMAIIAVQGKNELDLNGENIYKVHYRNEGNVTVENADIILLIDGENEAGRQTVTVAPNEQGVAEFTIDLADFDPVEDLGREVTLMGFVNVDGDVNADNNKSSMTATIVKNAPQATFEVVAAEAVTVAYGAESFEIKATVKNTSEVDAENVEVKLFCNTTIATKTIETLAAGAETEVTFTIEATEEAPFTFGRTVTYFVQAPKTQAAVEVTFEAEPVAEVIDMAITSIMGLSQIDLTKENKVQVWYENRGTVDLENVAVMLSVNDNAQEQAVSVAAGKSGYVEFTIDNADFEAGEDVEAELIAWVNVEGDADNSNDKQTRTVPVTNGETPVATFSVTAENVSVEYGAEYFEIKAVVENTSDVDATNVEVRLLKGITEVATTTISELPAGGKQPVVFQIEPTDENPFVAGTTATYYVQVAGQAQAEADVTFEQQPVEQVIDLAVTAIGGTLSVEVETNYLTIFVENKGTVDVTGAVVTLKAGETELGTGTVTVKAGSNGFCSIAVPATALQDDPFEVTATIEVEGDADLTNNTLTKSFDVVLPEAQVEITVADVTVKPNTTSFTIPVKVKNLRDNYAAKNVKVVIYDGFNTIGTATETIAAGAEVTVNVSIELETAYEENVTKTLKAWATGYSDYVEFTLTVSEATSINALMQQLGENVQVYTLEGKKVSTLKKGQVYIVNGRKVAVK